MSPELETVHVSTPLEYAQAALLLGEQRAWTEALVGYELAEIQPSSRREYANLADFYGAPQGGMLLARLDGEPVGVVAVRRIDDVRGEGKRLFVRPSARGYGIARRLLVEMFALARGLGCKSLYIETSPGKMAEQYEWYRRLGFRPTDKLNFAELDSVVAMELPL
jgi:GNAT superfamily N-acetyltransferase